MKLRVKTLIVTICIARLVHEIYVSPIDAACSSDDQTRGVAVLSFLSMINYDESTIGLRGAVHAHLLLHRFERNECRDLPRCDALKLNAAYKKMAGLAPRSHNRACIPPPFGSPRAYPGTRDGRRGFRT